MSQKKLSQFIATAWFEGSAAKTAARNGGLSFAAFHDRTIKDYASGQHDCSPMTALHALVYNITSCLIPEAKTDAYGSCLMQVCNDPAFRKAFPEKDMLSQILHTFYRIADSDEMRGTVLKIGRDCRVSLTDKKTYPRFAQSTPRCEKLA